MSKFKKVLALALSACMSLSLLAGCGGEKSPSASGAPAGNGGSDGAAGRVYWLNFKPELDAAAQELAATYTQKTGVPVQVVTAASGTYNQTLIAEMDKSEAPTLFVIGNQAGVKEWKDYALDLTGSAIANELNTDAYNLYDENGKLVSIGYCYECYGIIVNPDLVEKAGLNCGTENCWAINANVSEADQKATMDFMVWLVSDPDAAGRMVAELGVLPYKNAPESTNGFLAAAAEYTANGCYVMNWATNFQPNVDAYRATLVAALNQYNADQSDANWEQVRIAFVDGWAAQYQAVNG